MRFQVALTKASQQPILIEHEVTCGRARGLNMPFEQVVAVQPEPRIVGTQSCSCCFGERRSSAPARLLCGFPGSGFPHQRSSGGFGFLTHIKDRASRIADAGHNEPGANAGGKGDGT